MRKQYSEELKKTVLTAVSESPNKSYSTIALEFDIPKTTLYQWIKKSDVFFNRNNPTNKWKSKDKLRVLKDLSTLTEIETSEYCRKKGIYVSDVKKWEKQFAETDISQFEEVTELKEALKKSNDKIKILEKDNRSKEKALAEVATLLVLKKKADAIWGEQEVE